MEVWNAGAGSSALGGMRYSAQEQQRREKAYDEALRVVERELKHSSHSKTERLQTQARITAAFARFSATALGLEPDAIDLLTNDFLPIGTKLARWARRFDPSLSMADIVQACRNAWTACGLQPLLGEAIAITPSILGYSLLYPYSDNYLDGVEISREAKLRFSERFRERLRGEAIFAEDDREAAIWTLVGLIEEQYPRADFPEVFDCLLAIHRAQEQSIAQLERSDDFDDTQLLAMSCAKGGSSVMTDACLLHGWLSPQESRFSFEWGVLLQLGDDLQDVRQDLGRGSVTLFSRAAANGTPLDSLVLQLLRFSESVGAQMDGLPNGSEMLRELLRMSWRSLILGAIAESHEFFTPQFLQEAEECSPFRYGFLRARNKKLASRQGLYTTLFDAFLEAPDESDDDGLPLSTY
ncbi:MAG TPA: hypothetical protein VE195_09040, partial [Acidobacteriaceae bacterium]|nr:hypothetical protein [Acidobacteriaceae bacterium]